MPTGLFLALALTAAALGLWFAARRWYHLSDARRLDRARTMSGDIDVPAPGYESTLAISVAAPPPVVWSALLRFGWPRRGRATYEWLGRRFGYLEPQPASAPADDRDHLPIGRHSQIRVRSIDPARALVLGGATGSRDWAWQFELCPLDERRTRVILRDRARASSTPAWLRLAIPRALSFILTRKMLLDIKHEAEARG